MSPAAPPAALGGVLLCRRAVALSAAELEGLGRRRRAPLHPRERVAVAAAPGAPVPRAPARAGSPAPRKRRPRLDRAARGVAGGTRERAGVLVTGRAPLLLPDAHVRVQRAGAPARSSPGPARGPAGAQGRGGKRAQAPQVRGDRGVRPGDQEHVLRPDL